MIDNQAHGSEALMPAESPRLQFLRRISDWSLAGVLFVAPLAMGGRYPPGRLVLITLVSVAAVSWLLEQVWSRRVTSWTWSGAELIWGLAVGLVVLQLTPLSPSWLQRLSPQAHHILPLWVGVDTTVGESPAVWPAWTRVSLSPGATRGGLAMLLAYGLLFTVVSQRVRHRHEIERLLRGVALAGIGMAILGLVQYFVGNGKFLWFYEHPSRDTLIAVKGTFANENHFAHFLALTVGPVIWWLVKSHTEEAKTGFEFRATPGQATLPKTQVLLAFGLGALLLAGLLTYSRGGIAMMSLAAVVSIVFFAIQGKVGRRSVIALATVVVVASAAVWIHGQELLVREIETLQSADLESLDQGRSRRKIWSAISQAIPNFALLGSGVGSFRETYPVYFSEPSSVEYSHGESGYLQVLLETGGPGFVLLICGIGLSGLWIGRVLLDRRCKELAMLAVPIGAAWSVSVVHGLADFNWYIAANMSLTLVLMALAMRLWFLATPPRRSQPGLNLPRAAWALASGVAILVSVLGIRHYWGPARAAGHWDEYLAWSLAANRFHEKSIGPGRQRRVGIVDGASPDTVTMMMQQLEKALARNPRDARANVRMAALCLRQFELNQAVSDNAMSLAQIRDAALSSDFPSKAAMSNWVTKAVGKNRALLDRALLHAKRGVQLCPLQGRGYLYLSEVAFLDAAQALNEFDLMQQAYSVRPFDPSVQFVYGRQQLLHGDVERAMQLWKEAFRRGDQVRNRIIHAIGNQIDPQEIVGVFHPDVDGLKDLFEFYRRQDKRQQLEKVGVLYVTELERQANLLSGQAASQLWFDAQFAHSVLGDVDAAADAALRCVREQPSVYRNHFACALRLREAGRLQQAIEEFRWCQARRPDDQNLPRVVTGLQWQLRQATRSTPAEAEPRR